MFGKLPELGITPNLSESDLQRFKNLLEEFKELLNPTIAVDDQGSRAQLGTNYLNQTFGKDIYSYFKNKAIDNQKSQRMFEIIEKCQGYFQNTEWLENYLGRIVDASGSPFHQNYPFFNKVQGASRKEICTLLEEIKTLL